MTIFGLTLEEKNYMNFPLKISFFELLIIKDTIKAYFC